MSCPRARPKRRRGLAAKRAAERVPIDLIRDHGGLDTVDLVLFLMALNLDNRYIVVEALAGCGKTAMLSGLVQRLPEKKAVLLLSFTRQAITVARLRAGNAINVQTFDSLFFQTVQHGLGVRADTAPDTSQYTYESFRNLSETLSEEDLKDFVGKTDALYELRNIQLIMVDEAQDTPPQALRILDTFRSMNKMVVITGDRHQAIFGFMDTKSLFDSIPEDQKTLHFLNTTKRCCDEVASFINDRFSLHMKSAYPHDAGPEALDSVCVQALYNATLGRVYAKLLFTMDAPMQVLVSEGESTDKFWEAVHHEAGRMYSVGSDRAKLVVKQRSKELERRHRMWSQTPRQWRPPLFVFSTVHHFKGGECDVTILAEDIDLHPQPETGLDGERVKYVAASRAKWGIVAMKNVRWIGHPRARRLFRQTFLKSRENASRGTAPRISSVSELPASTVPLVASTLLDPWTSLFRERMVAETPLPPWALSKLAPPHAMMVGSLVDILLGWRLEATARRHRVPEIHISSSEFSASPLSDRKYARMKRDGRIPSELHAELKRLIARMKIQAAIGRFLAVFREWPLTSSLVVRAALAKARLQSFVLCGSVAVLGRAHLPLKARIRMGQILENATNLPGILGEPRTWVCINLQQQMIPNSSFFYRGSYDVLIVDRHQTSHLIEVKTVRTIQPTHCLQALLYTTVLFVSFGAKFPARWRTYVYETHRNELHHLKPEPLLRLASEDHRVLPELDSVLYAKLLPEFYNNQLSLDTVMSIL